MRASVPDGPDGALRRVLAGLPEQATGLLGRLRRVHPDPARRRAAVDDTRPLFPLGAIVAFAAGLTAAIAYESVVELLALFMNEPVDLRFASALAFVPLAVGVVGVAVWREAFAALADRRKPASPWVDGVAFALGLLLGPELALSLARLEEPLLRELASLEGLAWAAVLVGGIVLLLAWIRTSASWWLRALGGRRPGYAQAAGPARRRRGTERLHGCLLRRAEHADVLARLAPRLGAGACPGRHAGVGGAPSGLAVRHGRRASLHRHEAVLRAGARAARFFPYAAFFVRKRTQDAPWAFLDPGGLLRTPPLDQRPLEPLAIGAIAGLGFLALAVVVRLGVHSGVSPETRATDAAILSFFVSMVSLALLVQLVAGAAGAWRGGLVGALGAAFVAGCSGWLGIVGGPPRAAASTRSRSTPGRAPGRSSRASPGSCSSR